MNPIKSINRFAVFFFIFFIFTGYFLPLFPALSALPYAWYSSIVQLFYFGISIVLYFVITKKDIKETLRLYPLGWKNLILVILFAYVIQPSMSFLSYSTSIFS